MPSPAYVGNATGFGAAEGLDRVIRRHLEDEKFRQAQLEAERRQQIAQDEMRHRMILADNDTRATTASIAANEALGRQREAETGIINQRRDIIGGLMPVGPNPDMPGEAGGRSGMQVPPNTPAGRLQLSLIDPNMANEVYGSIPQQRPAEQYTPEETHYQAQAAKHGFQDWRQWAVAMPEEYVAAKKEWMKLDDRPFPTFMIPAQDPSNPAAGIWVPRDTAAEAYGQGAPFNTQPPAGARSQMVAYQDALASLDEIEKLYKEVGGGGMGPIEGPLDSFATRLGAGKYVSKNPEKEELLRNKVNAFKSQYSFGEGGKQFTGTEKQLLDSFLIAIDQAGEAFLPRLQQAKTAIRRRLGGMTGGSPNPKVPNAPGQQPTATDPYEEYLRRQRGGGPQ